MQPNGLTKSQKNLLQWLVQEVRSKKISEEQIWIIWNFNGTSIVGYENDIPWIYKTTLDALEKNSYLICERSHKDQYRCALTGWAYDAVDSDFKSIKKMKILFLSADPTDASRLRLGQELRDIREGLQLSKERDIFSLESRESVRPRDITQAIHDISPKIIHFSGHGASTGEICFENILGKTQPVTPEALASLFELVSDQVNCVLLNACYSEDQAKAISKHIPFVIGMNQAIGDRAAITFAVGFYKALGAGHSFEKSFRFAQVEMQLEGIPEHLTPTLYKKDTLPSNLSPSPESISVSSRSLDPETTLQPEDSEQLVLAFSSNSVPLEEAVRRFDVSPIVKRFGTWAVTTYGVECLVTEYPIAMDRVYELDWLRHMHEKTWTNMVDFAGALSYAQELNEIKKSLCIEGKSLQVFLGYGVEDKLVRALYNQLLAIGVEPWLDEQNLLPGQNWEREVSRNIPTSDAVIVCLSRASFSNTGAIQERVKYVLDVITEKSSEAMLIVPARLEDCDIPSQLKDRQPVNLFQQQGFERLIKSLQTCANYKAHS